MVTIEEHLCGNSQLLALFRHGALLGGVGIVALYLQDATGFRAGWAQLIFACVLLALALLVVDWPLRDAHENGAP